MEVIFLNYRHTLGIEIYTNFYIHKIKQGFVNSREGASGRGRGYANDTREGEERVMTQTREGEEKATT